MKNELMLKTKTHTINLDKELALLFNFFGINPNKDKLALAVFLELISSSYNGGRGIRTIDIVRKENVTQAAVVYHINNFMEKGFVIKQGRYYRLKGETIKETLEEMETEYLRNMDRMKKIAKRIDEFL